MAVGGVPLRGDGLAGPHGPLVHPGDKYHVDKQNHAILALSLKLHASLP